ncbi:MAG: glycosyltransferase, partial [Anaerolineales bacterium]
NLLTISMRFSVVIPTHNPKESLRRCLVVVASQDYPDCEFIVVDDASQDGTSDLVSLEIWSQNLLARYERYRTRQVYQLGSEVKIGWPVPVGTNNLAIKKEILMQLGGFDDDFPVASGEDADLLHRLAAMDYPTVCLPLSVAHHQTYTWPSFIQQQFRRGVGATYFLAKRGLLRSLARDYLLLFGLPFLFWLDAWRSRSFQIAFVSVVSHFLQILGRIRTRSDLKTYQPKDSR